jgi:hypothetical protein
MRLHFFGCSFTEGGGLDNFDYYNYNTNKNYNINDNIKEQHEEVASYKKEHRYSNIVGNLLNKESKNYAIGCNSNEAILKKVFEVVNDLNTSKDDIFIIQTTFYSRKFYWYEPILEFLSVNATEMWEWPYRDKKEWMPLHQLHNLNLKYTHNEEYEINKLLMNMELYNSYFDKKGIKIFWVPWRELTFNVGEMEKFEIHKKLLKTIPNIIFFDNKSMEKYIETNKLSIKDEFKNSSDKHKSIKGHQIIARKLIEFLKEKI